jgi:hypothetical protein
VSRAKYVAARILSATNPIRSARRPRRGWRWPVVFASWLLLVGHASAQQPMLCPGGTISLDVSAASKPFVRMRLGNREGNFLIDTGATRSFVDARLYGVAAGATIGINGSSLPTLEGGTFLAVDLSSENAFAPPGGFAGAIGTDILSTRTVEFHYEVARPYLGLSTQRCDPRVFEDAGFVSILQQGYGETEAWRTAFASRVGPRSEIVRRANLPIIYARIGAVSAPFWLDSGLGNGTNPHAAVEINDAILTRLRRSGAALKRAGDVINSDCEGHRAKDPLWQVAGGPIVLTTADGKPLFEYEMPTLQLLRKTTCGTAGNWPEPIGAIGARFLPRWGTVVFDGPNRRVWVPKSATTPAKVAVTVVVPRDGTRATDDE